MLACSGAVTEDLYRSQKSGKSGPRPQLDALRDLVQDPARSPDAVLFTFGGNDVGFVDKVHRCTATPTCRMKAVPHRVGSEVFYTYEDVTFEDVDALEGRLVDVYGDIDRTVNEPTVVAARGGKVIPIVVLPYVRGIPQGAYGDSLPGSCQLGLSGKDLIFLNEFLTRLNTSVLGATLRMRKARRPVYYAADVERAFLPGHTVCEKTGSYLNYSAGLFRWWTEENKELLHPNRAGYAAEAFALASWAAATTVIKAGPAQPYEHPTGELTLPARVVAFAGAPANEAGSQVSRTSSGWAAGATVSFVLSSDPRLLGSAVADGHGQVSVAGRIPEDVPPGAHHLVMTGLAADGTARRTSDPVTVHRQGFVLGWVGVGLGLVALAGAVVIARRAGAHSRL